MLAEEERILRQKAQSYKEKITNFVLTTNPQIDGFKDSYKKYYEYVVTTSGIFAGLTQAFLASSFPKNNVLAILGFIFFILAVMFAFLGFKNGLISGAKYTIGLKDIHKVLSDFSNVSTQLSRNEVSPEEYKTKLEDFEKKYINLRNNIDMEKADVYENSMLKEISESPFSNLNLLTVAFMLGLVFVGLSVLVPWIFGNNNLAI